MADRPVGGKIPWGKIRRDYIAGKGTQHQLAEKYGVSKQQMADKCRFEGWVALKKEAQRKIRNDLPEVIARATLNRVGSVTYDLLDQVEAAAKQASVQRVETVERTVTADGKEIVKKTYGYEQGKIIDKQGLKQLTSAIRDLADVLQGLARPEQGDGDREIRVIFGGDPDAEDLAR